MKKQTTFFLAVACIGIAGIILIAERNDSRANNPKYVNAESVKACPQNCVPTSTNIDDQIDTGYQASAIGACMNRTGKSYEWCKSHPEAW